MLKHRKFENNKTKNLLKKIIEKKNIIHTYNKFRIILISRRRLESIEKEN